MIESEHFSDLTYAIDHEGKGMHLLLKEGKEVAICDPVTFVMELFEVWKMHGKGN